MKRFFKWAILVVLVLGLVAFVGFLYFIPPFTLMPPEAFSQQEADAPPSLDHILDPVTRAIAERGKEIVTRSGCTGCHTPAGPEGPDWNRYLAGGSKSVAKGFGTFYSKNLTPDPETGLGRRSDEEVMRVLRNGISHDGRVIHGRAMPWTVWSNLSDEDLYAVIVYLRHLKPVVHRIPDFDTTGTIDNPEAIETFFGADFGVTGEMP